MGIIINYYKDPYYKQPVYVLYHMSLEWIVASFWGQETHELGVLGPRTLARVPCLVCTNRVPVGSHRLGYPIGLVLRSLLRPGFSCILS